MNDEWQIFQSPPSSSSLPNQHPRSKAGGVGFRSEDGRKLRNMLSQNVMFTIGFFDLITPSRLSRGGATRRERTTFNQGAAQKAARGK